MKKENKWPCWTTLISPLAFKHQSTIYAENIGYCHKTIINLIKTTSTFVYEIHSNQSWLCCAIVWTSNDRNYHNRPTDTSSTLEINNEFELSPFIGVLKYDPTSKRKSIIEWKEEYITYTASTTGGPGTYTESESPKSLTNLLECPRNQIFINTILLGTLSRCRDTI